MDAIFKAYDIRGVYGDQLNEDLAWCIGYATGQFLRSQLSGYDRTDSQMNTLAVGRDMRKSSAGLCDMCAVIFFQSSMVEALTCRALYPFFCISTARP